MANFTKCSFCGSICVVEFTQYKCCDVCFTDEAKLGIKHCFKPSAFKRPTFKRPQLKEDENV